MSRHSRTSWSRSWSIDASPPSRRRRFRAPVVGLALAGAVALTPIPLSNGSGDGRSPAGLTIPGDPTGGSASASSPGPERPMVELPRTGAPRPAQPTVERPAHPATLHGYVWPLPRGRLTQAFGPTRDASRIVDGDPFHDGIDLATFCGDRIVAAHDGRVLAAGRRFDQHIGYIGSLERYFERIERRKVWGSLPIVVVVDDGNGYRSMYAHFSRVVVKRGQRVRAGQLLGHEGATGNASGCHLHYGLFSPLETERFRIRPDIARRWKLPRTEVARIDPLLVLPERFPRGGDPSGPLEPRRLSRSAGSGVQ